MASQDDLSDQELDTSTLLEKSWRRPSAQKCKTNCLRLSLLTLSLAFNAVLLGCVFLLFLRGRQPSYENGFASDLKSVRSQIRLTEYTFSGGVDLDQDGRFFVSQEGHQYVGDPTLTPGIDDAWDHLQAGLNIDLDGDDDANLTGTTYQWPDTGRYFTGLEVFHSLHCLNRLRQALYPNFYQVFSNPDDPSRHDHIGHCINHIRQALQCHADVTPMKWKRVGDKLILDTATRHTCRDFAKIHDWARQRQTRFDNIASVANGSIFIVD
ncbi:hypothetical protein B0H66DRAFT_644099 [Apodospora peruviana]|uniref:Tat pathway signal sequence n=1 Tax=Apodospora peruviana TaxID=516989 RepID=A0AAE0HU71_9PEZI|nr:hypothetical protein B0H66DRAFT_644099 [Apodospora peruviana]